MASTIDDLDDETANLILRLQLEDIEELKQNAIGGTTDTGFAHSTYETELRHYQAIRGFPIDDIAPPIIPVPTIRCVSCTDDFALDNVSGGPCEHDYCRTCLNTLFRDCITDETLYPPRCCRQEIPFENVAHLLERRVQRDFAAKKPELDDNDRIYCHIPTCSAYIAVDDRVGDLARCIECRELTCTICKNAAHRGRDCPEDQGTQSVLALAQTEGWQRCSECGRMVALATGCNHMT